MDIFNVFHYFSDAAAIIDDGESLSYKNLNIEIDRFALQIKKRVLVAILLDNNPESIIGYLGCLKCDAAILMINNTLDDEKAKVLLHQYQPAYIFIPSYRTIAESSYKEVYSYRSYCLYKGTNIPNYNIHENLSLLLTTSGSTGKSKSVRISYNNLSHNTESISKSLDIQQNDRAITSLPLGYTYGLSILNTHFYNHASVVLNRYSIIDSRFWDSLLKNGVTTFGGVPFTYELLLKFKLFSNGFGKLRYLTQAGGKLAESLTARLCSICRDHNVKFITMYGQTEATARMTYLPWEYAFNKMGSVGIPIPGGIASIERDTSLPVDNCLDVGELLYEGKNVSMGYAYSFADLELGDCFHGILRTGDIARCDKDGFFYIMGRKSQFVKIYSNRVSTKDIEDLLFEIGITSACFSIEDYVYIFIEQCNPNEEDGIIAELKKISLYQDSYKIIYLKTMPRLETGKIDYGHLKELVSIKE
jgi:acyl-CoA synthetase (AMP-forming)/AMP-acid ligase II